VLSGLVDGGIDLLVGNGVLFRLGVGHTFDGDRPFLDCTPFVEGRIALRTGPRKPRFDTAPQWPVDEIGTYGSAGGKPGACVVFSTLDQAL
jgi:hypothetical protein